MSDAVGGSADSGEAASAAAPSRVTLSDVAKQAGVSIATVSYVMNERGGVGEQTRANVLRIADELGFRLNRVASGLRTGRTQVLGLVLADITNPFYPEIAGGVIQAAAEAGFQVFLSHGGTEGGLDGEIVRALCDHQCGALIFTSLVVSDGPLLSEVVPPDVPIVQTVRRIPGIRADFVGIDDRAGAREEAQHILDLGHRDIAILAGPSASSASSERTAGYREALAEAGIELSPESVLECSLTADAGYRAAQQLLEPGPHLPTAVLCGNDLIALGAVDAFLAHGLSVPEDVSVAGYDDIWFASSRLVQLTTVRQPRHEMGRAAVSLALERLADPDLPPRDVIMEHGLVVRRTTTTARAGTTT